MRIIAAVLSALAWLCASAAAEEKAAYEPMAYFASLAGKAWRGEGTGPDGKPIVDIARYEMILGGRAFQSTHRLEDGSYGGRTIIFYDEGAKKHIFHYFTTVGFHTTGEITPTEKGFTAVEKVEGHPEFAEVRSQAFIEDGVMRIETSHVTKNGETIEGEGLVYREIDDPGPLFINEADALPGKRSDVKDAHGRYENDDE